MIQTDTITLKPKELTTMATIKDFKIIENNAYAAAAAEAEAHGLRLSAILVGPLTTKRNLLGYVDVHGKYVPSLLRHAYEHGGVVLLDEVDAGSPAVADVIESVTSGDSASFPDKTVQRHVNFILLCGK